MLLGLSSQAQITSESILNPVSKIEQFCGTSSLPKFYLELANANIQIENNFRLGQALGGDVGEKLKLLAQSTDAIASSAQIRVRPFAMIYSKKNKYFSLSTSVKLDAYATVDSDLLQLLTEGIYFDGLSGSYQNINNGFNSLVSLYEQISLGYTQKVGNGSFGMNLNVNAPLFTLEFQTLKSEMNRSFSLDTNYIDFEFEAVLSSFGEENALSAAMNSNLNANDLRPQTAYLTMDFGLERKLNPGLFAGIAIQGLTLSTDYGPAKIRNISAKASFSGASFTLGQDSLNSLISGISNQFNLEQSTTLIESEFRITPILDWTIFARKKYNDNSEFYWYYQSIRRPSFNRSFSGVYYYDRSNKFVHAVYGASYLMEYGIFNPNISVRMLVLPWTRLSLTLNNPLNLPRFGSGGGIFLNSDWNGLNFNVCLSFGKYKEA